MDGSPLGKLAAELRNEIWKYAVTQDEAISITRDQIRGLSFAARPSSFTDPTAVLKVCRQTNAECSGLFYGLNTFAIAEQYGTKEDVQLFEDFKRTIGDAQGGSLRTVDFETLLTNGLPARQLRLKESIRDRLAGLAMKAYAQQTCRFTMVMKLTWSASAEPFVRGWDTTNGDHHRAWLGQALEMPLLHICIELWPGAFEESCKRANVLLDKHTPDHEGFGEFVVSSMSEMVTDWAQSTLFVAKNTMHGVNVELRLW